MNWYNFQYTPPPEMELVSESVFSLFYIILYYIFPFMLIGSNFFFFFQKEKNGWIDIESKIV
jgi:hypothetical protein